jgi:hypothetical protein
MNTSHQLAERLKEVFLSGTWIANTNFKAQLTNIDWEKAVHKTGTLNTIADLSQHINYYLAGVTKVLQDGSLDISDKFSFDFPPLSSAEHWDKFLKEFWKNAELFITLVSQLTEEQLHLPFVDEKYGTYQRNIEAMIEHSYYHLGQIVLLGKMNK